MEPSREPDEPIHTRCLAVVFSQGEGDSVGFRADILDLRKGGLMALAGRILGRSFNVYCLVGDGELQEGQVWEAAMAASHHRLDRLTVLVDNNKMETDGETHEVSQG